MKKIQLFLLQGLLSSVPLYTLTAQTTTPSTHYAVETGIVAGHGDYSPFWFTANRQGLSSVKTENGYLRAGIFHSQALGRHFTWKAGLDLATAYNYTSSFVVQQAYADLSYRWLNLSIGSKERTPELRNPKLSTGGLVESNSARPVPQVRIEIPQYISVPGTNHWLHIKGHLAYGTFTDNNWQEDFARSGNLYTKDVLYHSKSFFMKVGKKESFPLEFEAGLQMAAQFGGKQYVEGQKEPIMKMPSDFMDFIRVLIPMSGSDNAMEGEQINKYGNHVGSWNIGLTGYVQDWRIKAYYEHFFEDESQMFFGYGPWKDGLLGVEVTLPENQFIDALVYECMGSKNQTGPIFYEGFRGEFEQVSAKDNYYNHYIYQAWQHWGMAMGNPLFTDPVYNKDGRIMFANNRINAHHLGISGTPGKEWAYRLLLTYSRNWGTYDNPFDDVKKQFSSLLEVTYSPVKWNGWSFSISGAMDRGNLLGNNSGGMLVIRKTGLIK